MASRDRQPFGKPLMGRPLTGRHVLFALLAFFGCILLVNGVFVYVALDSWTGLTTKHAYVKGLDYNQELAAGARQRALGWQVEVAAAPVTAGRWRLSARFLDDGGRPVEDLQVEVELSRPTREGLDRRLDMPRVGKGLYAVDFEPAALGNWDAAVTAQRRGEAVYRREQRLWLK